MSYRHDQPSSPTTPDARTLALLTIGHCLIDMCQGAVPALLPLFVLQYHLGYAAAGALVLASSLASSIVQPLFGMFADRTSAPWLLPASLLATGVGLVGAILAPDYGLALIGVAVSGLGVAAFHPEAARFVYLASGPRRTTGMSYFSVGGGLGFALAPLLVAGLLAIGGGEGFTVLLLPAFLLAGLFGLHRRRFGELANRGHHADLPGAAPPGQWPAFALLGVVIAVRSAAFVGLNAFLVLYWVQEMNGSDLGGRAALAVLLGSGVVGALAGGRLADRWGRRLVIQVSLVAAAILLGLLGATRDPLLAILLLAPLGLVMSAATSVVIVLGQEYLPGRVGVASGVTIGLAVSCGGAAAPVLGLAAEHFGLGVLPGLLGVLALTAAALALPLPRPGQPRTALEAVMLEEAEPAPAAGG